MDGWKSEGSDRPLYPLPLSGNVYGVHYRMKYMILMLSVCLISN